jgi:methyl-accepting chemotaxis protein
MIEEFAVRFIVLLLGIAWSVIFYFGRRTLSAMDKKIDANFERMDNAYRSLNSSLERSDKRMRHEGRLWRKSMAKQLRMMKAVTDRTIAGNNKTLQKLFVTRQEFGAYIANINHKIDSIYETVKPEKEGANQP